MLVAEREKLTLNHIGVAVAAIPESAEFYVGHLGYTVESPIIHDPRQTAFVQFFRLAGDTAYLELVAPDGPDSKLAAAVRKGGGLNHVCYAVADIEAAMTQLDSIEMTTLCPPVPAVAFPGRRIAWLRGNHLAIELVEAGKAGQL